MSNSIRFVGFNKYIREQVKENKNRNWVMNGNKNRNYQYIIDRYNGSTTNKAINNAYVDLAYGRGLGVLEDANEDTIVEEFHKLMSKKCLRAVLQDYQIFGEFSVQILRQKGNKSAISKIIHVPKNSIIPSVANEDGLITSYWYSKDWDKYTKHENVPEQFPAFGFGKGGEVEIYVGKPYQIGQEYFALPDYDACLQYAEIEEEISNYYLTHIKSGLSFGSVINVPNSAHWTDKQKDDFIANVKGNYTGSTGAGKIAFNFKGHDTGDTTISNVENNNAHEQWTFLTEEATRKILAGHKCPSPSLVGLNASTGFSSTADEMDTMEEQILKRVIAPKQEFVLDSLKEILSVFGLENDYYFRPLTEIKGEDEEESKVNEADEVEEKKEDENIEFSNDDLNTFIAKGETYEKEGYNIVLEEEVDYTENVEFETLVKTGTARPNAKSGQDSDDIVIRYKYVGNPNPERPFCKAMMKANKVYRKEDILQLSNKVVNPGWGPNGIDTYSIWLYKGGGSCHHKWQRVIYLKQGKSVDVNSPLAKRISTSEARRRGYKVPTNDTKVSVMPKNMTNKGFLNPR